MKNRIIFLMFFTGCSLLAAGQDYFGEVGNISKFNKMIKSLCRNGAAEILLDSASGAVNVKGELLSTLIALSGSTKTALSSSGLQGIPNAFNPPQGGISQVIVAPVNGSIPVNNPVTPVNSAVKVEPEIDSSIFNELKYLSFLCFNNVKSDHENKQLRQNFPAHFDYLEKIIFAMQRYSNELLGTPQSKSGLGSNFAFSESAIIFGITDWAIKEAKQELMNVYLENWYKKLEESKVISPVIPQTLKVFEAFRYDNSLNLAKYGDKWKAAFQEDIRNIPVLLQDTGYVNVLFTELGMNRSGNLYKQLMPVITGGDELIYNLYLKKHLVDVLSNMANKYNRSNDPDFPIFERCVIMANLFATVCGQMQDNKYVAVPLETLKKMNISDWKFLFKLILLRQSKSLEHALNEATPDFISKIIFENNTTAGEVSQVFQETVSIIGAYQNMLSSTQPGSDKQISFEDVRKLFDLNTQLFNNVSKFLQFSINERVKQLVGQYNREVKPFIVYLSEVGEGVSTKQYGKVLDGAISILGFADSLKNPGNPQLSNTIYKLQRYGSFMVNILTAQNSDAVEAALDELIPKGQYQLKNKKAFTISLSVYPGVFAGIERIKKYNTDNAGNPLTNQKKTSSSKGSLAFYLPVGIDFNFGYETKKSKETDTNNSRNEKKYASNNIFIQVLDLGAVLNYRLTAAEDSTEKSEPQVSFKQVLSPGINFMHHFNNSPVVIGLGMNYTPSLRTVQQKTTTYSSNALRFGLFASVDVTALLLNISNKNAR